MRFSCHVLRYSIQKYLLGRNQPHSQEPEESIDLTELPIVDSILWRPVVNESLLLITSLLTREADTQQCTFTATGLRALILKQVDIEELASRHNTALEIALAALGFAAGYVFRAGSYASNPSTITSENKEYLFTLTGPMLSVQRIA